MGGLGLQGWGSPPPEQGRGARGGWSQGWHPASPTPGPGPLPPGLTVSVQRPIPAAVDPAPGSVLCPPGVAGGGCALSRGTSLDLGAGPWPGLSRSCPFSRRSDGNAGWQPPPPAPGSRDPSASAREAREAGRPALTPWLWLPSLTLAPRRAPGPAAPPSGPAPARDTLDRRPERPEAARGRRGQNVGPGLLRSPPDAGLRVEFHDLLKGRDPAPPHTPGSRTPGRVLDGRGGGHRPGPRSGQGPPGLRAPQGPACVRTRGVCAQPTPESTHCLKQKSTREGQGHKTPEGDAETGT